jgi:O-methyltransferase
MEILKKIANSAYSYPQTVVNSFELAQKVCIENIEGDLVECGVAAGSQIAAFQVALENFKATGVDRLIYAFDSFEGIPLAGEFDTEQAGIGAITHDKYAPIEQRLVSSGITVHSQENVMQNFANWGLPIDNIVFVKGWFQHTIESKAKSIKAISILRLDGDLHESTLICLKYLYPLVSKGGFVIIDDYALEGCRVAVRQYFESIKKPLPEMINVDGHGVHYFIK